MSESICALGSGGRSMVGAVAIARLDLTAEGLRSAASVERDGAAARRILALALILEGADRASAARICGMDRQTLRDWVHRYNDEGLAGLRDRIGGGRSPGSGANSRRRKASRVVLSRLQAWSTAFHTAGASRPWTPRRPSPNCSLRMRCINSMPAIVIAAVAKPLKPSIVAIRCFT